MKTKTYKVYSFDELSKEAKQKAIETWRENDDLPFLSVMMEERLTDLLMENKLDGKHDNLCYSLSHCQRDGVCFTGTFQWKRYTVYVKQDGHYTNENSKVFDIEDREGNPVYNDTLHAEFNNLYVKICKEMESYGYDYIDHEQSDEAIISNLNEYEFTEDGKID